MQGVHPIREQSAMFHRNLRGRNKNLKMLKLHETCSQLIIRKIIKIIATRCHILRLKCTKFNSGWASPQTPLGELTALPQAP